MGQVVECIERPVLTNRSQFSGDLLEKGLSPIGRRRQGSTFEGKLVPALRILETLELRIQHLFARDTVATERQLECQTGGIRLAQLEALDPFLPLPQAGQTLHPVVRSHHRRQRTQ